MRKGRGVRKGRGTRKGRGMRKARHEKGARHKKGARQPRMEARRRHGRDRNAPGAVLPCHERLALGQAQPRRKLPEGGVFRLQAKKEIVRHVQLNRVKHLWRAVVKRGGPKGRKKGSSKGWGGVEEGGKKRGPGARVRAARLQARRVGVRTGCAS